MSLFHDRSLECLNSEKDKENLALEGSPSREEEEGGGVGLD